MSVRLSLQVWATDLPGGRRPSAENPDFHGGPSEKPRGFGRLTWIYGPDPSAETPTFSDGSGPDERGNPNRPSC